MRTHLEVDPRGAEEAGRELVLRVAHHQARLAHALCVYGWMYMGQRTGQHGTEPTIIHSADPKPQQQPHAPESPSSKMRMLM